jgi:hypothetical protein
MVQASVVESQGCDGNPKEKKKKKMILRLSKNYIYLSQVCRLVEDLRQLVAYNLHTISLILFTRFGICGISSSLLVVPESMKSCV